MTQGREYTGQSIKSIEPPSFAEKGFAELRAVYEKRAPVHVITRWLVRDAEETRYDILRVPFCDGEGTVTQILTLTVGGPNFHRVYDMFGTKEPAFFRSV